MNPILPVTVSKKLNSLTLKYKDGAVESTGVFDIEDGVMNIIELDMWVSDLLFKISEKDLEKNKLRKKLLGE